MFRYRVVLQYGPGALPWTSIQLSHDNTESAFNYCSKSKTSACGGCHSSKLSACFVNCDLCTFQLAPHFLQGYHTTKPGVRKWLDCSMHVFVHGLFSTWKGQKILPAFQIKVLPTGECVSHVHSVLGLSWEFCTFWKWISPTEHMAMLVRFMYTCTSKNNHCFNTFCIIIREFWLMFLLVQAYYFI